MNIAERLQSHVLEELAFDPKVDSSAIAVTATANGVVTLEGRVPEYAQKRAAEAAAKRIAGVRAVANDIEVTPKSAHELDDTAIAAAALDALTWTSFVPLDEIGVSVSNGWITLEGTVRSWFQKTAAYNAVHDVRGVRGVVNEIVVDPQASADEVKQKIESAFRRSARLDADSITVSAEGTTVTLSGTVGSWSELEEAERSAWSAPGVAEVKNLLELE